MLKMADSEGPDSKAQVIHEQKQLFKLISSKVALVNRLPIPYMESINNPITAYIRIAVRLYGRFI